MIKSDKGLERLEELMAADAEMGLSDIQRQELRRLIAHYFNAAPEELDDYADITTPAKSDQNVAQLPNRIRAKLLLSAIQFLSGEVGSPCNDSRATEPIERRDRDKS